MKGLILKDLIILRSENNVLLLLAICGTAMSVVLNPTAVISYLTIMAVMMALGTIGYDEFDNGFSYLFTLPVSRKTYVREKYLFSLLWALCCQLLGTVISMLLIFFTKQGETEIYLNDVIPTMAGLLAVSLILLAVTIPLRIKYGSEKGKTRMYILYAVLVVAAIGIMKGGTFLGEGVREKLLAIVQGWKEAAVLLVLLLAAVIVLIISEQITERIIKKKEY